MSERLRLITRRTLTGFEMLLVVVPVLWAFASLVLAAATVVFQYPLWPFALVSLALSCVSVIIQIRTLKEARVVYAGPVSPDNYATASQRAYQSRVRKSFWIVLAILVASYAMLYVTALAVL